jgi:hypothetical protein
VTIVLPSTCLTLMTVPVAVKLPVPDSRVEAFALAGTKNRDASRGSAANAALDAFIVNPFETLADVREGRAGAWAGPGGIAGVAVVVVIVVLLGCRAAGQAASRLPVSCR